YGSALALAEDLRRYLDGRPIQARPVSRLERTWRWCRRDPAAAGVMAGGGGVGVVGGGAPWVLGVGAVCAKGRGGAQRRRADDNATEAEDSAAKARANADAADANAAETRRRMAEFCVRNGVRLADEGELFGALLWFAEPLVQNAGNPQTEAMVRLRLAAYRQH